MKASVELKVPQKKSIKIIIAREILALLIWAGVALSLNFLGRKFYHPNLLLHNENNVDIKFAGYVLAAGQLLIILLIASYPIYLLVKIITWVSIKLKKN